MLDSQPSRSSSRPPRPSKLRSSCDACGAAKLKCDRGKPECERCISLGLQCVYGISRKMGKPPRQRAQSRTARSDSNGGGTESINVDARQFHIPSGWDSEASYSDTRGGEIDMPDILHSSIFGSSFPEFKSLDLGDDFLSANIDIGLKEYTDFAPPNSAPRSQIDENMHGYFDNPPRTAAGCKGQDCSQEAHNILTGLLLLNLNQAHYEHRPSYEPRSTPGPAPLTPNVANRVPLDHILHLNRDSSKRLSRLLTCSCARFPQLAVLYASIISQVLNLYYEAADCATQKSLSPMTGRPRSISGSSSPWSNQGAGPVNSGDFNAQLMARAAALAIAPTQMTVGSFDIDDQQVQTALRIQLLLGEITKIGFLIDLFTSESSSGLDEYNFGRVDGLHKSLSSWLRQEHLRVSDIMRSRLKDVSI
ncbi:hypothetical protein BGW36DRAFT_358488 [Talaromyces proteolyticus]|uniref:Zn(2)-C6 fungal-type domain-containing protein n=1 Tax=Talaromyces proteolyticus TaxID=1131652 RepID=A0AAD4PZF8_9EURO|nr:uncharacterized protein BGW36DRAFT_358488 [Talaromyces proteolyticus]KAH8698981.1 hypothetical protein BGW36DRAFT_358488 [Talaromyces proteolyticus]